MTQKLKITLTVAVMAALAAPQVWADASIFTAQKCNDCHVVKNKEKGVDIKKAEGSTKAVDEEESKDDREAPNLGDVGKRHDAGWIEAFLQKKEKLKGRKHTRRFRGSADELTKLAKWLESLK